MAPLNRLKVHGSLRPPGDKSISHRALILAAVTRGKSHIRNILDSADVRSTARALHTLGADIPKLSDSVVVTGKASRFLATPSDPLDCGNSGTTARLLAGVVAGAGVSATFRGDASLSARPMRRVAEPLRAMGASVSLGAHGGLPMTVVSGPLRAVEWHSRVASAQVKSAILLAALLAGVRARVDEPHRSRDHTERMLRARGVDVRSTGNTVEIAPGQLLRPDDLDVPGDPSSAAYFAALAVLASDGELLIERVCLNETRLGFFDVLRRMGAEVEMTDIAEEDGEPVGTIIARPSHLEAIEIGPDEVPAMIDELPLFACLAAHASGESVVRGAAELRVKESDRIAAVVSNLRRLGIEAEELPDGFRVRGSRQRLSGGVETRGDHRIAMSFGVLAQVPGNDIRLDDRRCVEISFPTFWSDLGRATS